MPSSTTSAVNAIPSAPTTSSSDVPVPRAYVVSDYLAAFLAAQGVTHVFELVGGMITHLLDALHRHGKLRIVSMHHEQGAGFAAEGMGRISGIPGVALATSGPGATNLLTAIGSCYFDSTPAVFITGQVNRHEQKGERAIRQLGFQETDIVAMAGPVTKRATLVNDPAEIPEALTAAFRDAMSGRPGPILLDIPMDVQRATIHAPPPIRVAPSRTTSLSSSLVRDVLAALRAAERPLILAGGGIRGGLATDAFRALVDRLEVPVVHSLMGVDLLPANHPRRVGMIGSYGNRWANIALARADLLVVLGSRLDVRQTGSQAAEFKGARTIYHIDCERGEINNRITGCVAVPAEAGEFLAEAIRQSADHAWPARSVWEAEIAVNRARWPDTAELADVSGINPNTLMHRLSAGGTAAAAYVVDVGQHQMWAAQSLDLTAPQRFITSGGMGAMGFALPASIGVAMGKVGTPVVVIAGDGAFQLNIQEMQTVRRNDLPLKMVVINNGCHGMVRQFQQSYFHERYTSTYWGYSAPAFVDVAKAYHIEATSVREPEELDAAIRAMFANPAEPFLLEVMIDTFANAYPKMAFGLPITEMEPLAKPTEMEGT